jgi:hypothetical protein
MRGALAYIRNEYGGAEGYFKKMTNLDQEVLNRLRSVLLRDVTQPDS